MIDAKARMHALSQTRADALWGPASLYYVEEQPLYSAAKRLFDVIIAAIALLVLSPLMAVIALLVRLDSRGPAVFAQRRVGKGGVEFTVFKFRTMRSSGDESIHRQFAKQYIRGQCQRDANGCFKPQDDPRITGVGRILRQTSLDELPQLLNVLKGDMSLVGPRPVVRYEVEEYERWQLRRLAVIPGLTGLAQVSGRSGLAFSEIIRRDLEYIEKRSLLLDAQILVKTIPTVLSHRSAG